MCLTETWLQPDEESNCITLASLLPDGFKIIHRPRKDGRKGGGVGMIFSEKVPLTLGDQTQFNKFNQFEVMCSSLNLRSGKIAIFTV